MLLLKAAIVGVVAYVVSGRETLAHIVPLSCEILDETIDGQSRLNAMLNISALLDALIQRGVATLVWDAEMLNILTQRGQVTHFVEKIPSVTDIFIQTVSEK